MAVREVLRRLGRDGRAVVRTRGDRRPLKHAGKSGTVTVVGRFRDDLHQKTLSSILRQAGS